jgi:hypothetical protein
MPTGNGGVFVLSTPPPTMTFSHKQLFGKHKANLEKYFDSMCKGSYSEQLVPALAQLELNAEELSEHLFRKDKTHWSKAELGLLVLLSNRIF